MSAFTQSGHREFNLPPGDMLGCDPQHGIVAQAQPQFSGHGVQRDPWWLAKLAFAFSTHQSSARFTLMYWHARLDRAPDHVFRTTRSGLPSSSIR